VTLGSSVGRGNLGSSRTADGFCSIESLSSVRPLKSFRNIAALGAFVCLSHYLSIGWGVGCSSGVLRRKCLVTLRNIGGRENFGSIRTADWVCSIGSLSSVRPLELFRNIGGLGAFVRLWYHFLIG